jgi:hypothetical protein
MKLTSVVLVALAGRATATSMEVLRQLKLESWSNLQEAGAYDFDRYQALRAGTPCVNGMAGEYQCNKVDLMAFLRHQDMGSSTRKGNDVCKWPSSP